MPVATSVTVAEQRVGAWATVRAVQLTARARVPFELTRGRVRGRARRAETSRVPATVWEATREIVTDIAAAELRELGRELSVQSHSSWFSIFAHQSLASVGSAWSALSVGSVGSLGSVGSICSVGAAGSILSIGSSGSILSIGSAGGFLSIGSSGETPWSDEAPTVDATVVRNISGLLAVAAVVAAPFSRSA